MKKYKIEVNCSECGRKQSVNIAIGQPQAIVCLYCGTTYGLEIAEVEPRKDITYCYHCQDEKAEHIRNVPIRRKDGYKLCAFEAHLCDSCNSLSGDFLSDYFSI